MQGVQFRREHIEDRAPALFVLTGGDQPFGFVKKDEPWSAWLKRLLVEGDHITGPVNPRVRSAHDALIDADSSRLDPFLCLAPAGDTQF
jgi:hypothetical protein